MHILHVGAASSLKQVDGVNATVWGVAGQQSRNGNCVSLLLNHFPDEEAKEYAQDAGINLIYDTTEGWTYDHRKVDQFIARVMPDLVHFHSVFVPHHAWLAARLTKYKIPYIVTPHGGVSPIRLQRNKLKKKIYSLLIERRRFYNASAVTVVAPGEEDDVRQFVPNYQGEVKWVSNPVEVSLFEGKRWMGRVSQKRLVFLGRFDVYVKGIDLLVEIGRNLPNVRIDLYGSEEPKTEADLAKLKQNLPANIHFQQSVFGQEKVQILADASLYIQTARAEGFPLSVAEAMYLGVPCAINETLKLAGLFQTYDLGLLLPLNTATAAQKISQMLSEVSALQRWSQRAEEFARQHFSPQVVAENYLDLYHRAGIRRRA